MSITYTIPGATLLDQLAPATLDGLPNNNANDDCVPTSIAEGLHILTGKTFDGDEVKDAVYGAGYVGVMAAEHFIAYCAAHGVSLTAHNDSQAGLIATLTAEVAKGHPVVLTMPSQWGTAPADPVHPSGNTHVGIAVGFGPSEIRVMNPWHGFFQDAADDWWQARLCYGQIWIMAPTASTQTTGASNMALTRNADGSATDHGNGLSVGSGIAAYIFTHNLESADLLTGEVSYTNGGQRQSACALSSGVVVRWYGSGADTNASAVMTGLMSEIDSAQQTTSATHAQLVDAQSQIAALHSQLTQAQAELATAQATLAAEKANSEPPAPIQPSTPPVTPAPSGGSVSASGAASSSASPTPAQGASIVNIFAKAWANINMTPQERMLLRLIEGWLWAGMLAALGVVMTYISSGHLAINQQTITMILGAGFAAVLSAVKKYVSAHGDLLNSSGSQS